MNRMTVFDRWGNFVSELSDVLAATWTQEINALSTLEIQTRQELQKGQRIVWRDDMLTWHEHIVTSTDYVHDSGDVPILTAYCVDSLSELSGDYIVDKRPGVSVQGGVGARVALESALEDTRWTVGTVEVATMDGQSLYHESAWDAVSDIIDKWGGEFDVTLTVNNFTGVTARALNLRNRIGSDKVTRRFEWTRDLISITRTYDDESVCTALYCWGKGLELQDEEGEATGAYGRRIGISDVTPDGLAYVHDDEAKLIWGRPGTDGTIEHVFGEFLDENCEDPEELYEEGLAYLADHIEPLISYEASVVQFGAAGLDLSGVSLGDYIQVVDKGFETPLRLAARVISMTTNLLQPGNPDVTIGNFIPGIDDLYESVSGKVGGLTDRSASWEAMQSASAGYISRLVDELNDLFASSGAFATFDFANGLTFTDHATYEESTSAINICGAGFRISSEKDSSGGWVWSTYGTGLGFVSSYICGGTLQAGMICSVDQSSWWNLDTGEVHITTGGVDLSDIYTQLQLTNDALTVAITQKNEEVTSLQQELSDEADYISDNTARINEITSYVRIGTDSSGMPLLNLGTTTNNMTVEMTNSQLSFLNEGAVVAYVNNQELYETNVTVTDQLKIGPYAFIPRDTHMSLVYIG